MPSIVSRIVLIFTFISALGLGLAGPAPAAMAEKTLSPYFFIENGEEGVDRLPLKSTEVSVTINAVIAQVKVMQRYANEGTRPIHGRYVFPASTRAAVHGMRMQVGEQTVVARIQERQAATRTFQAAELLAEEMPAENWQRFLSNTRTEADRIQTIVDRMLELADLQFKKQLIHRRINLDALVKTVLESKHPLLAAKQMAVQSHIAPHLKIQGDPFLLHQALANQVKEVAELHQGAIRPENIPPQGVRTTLTLGR